MNEKEASKAKFGRDSAVRKGLFERAILAGWAPFSLGVLFFAALGIWALNLSTDEILELKFWLPFICGVRVFAPFLDDFANDSALYNLAAGLGISFVFSSFAHVAYDLIYRLRSGRPE